MVLLKDDFAKLYSDQVRKAVIHIRFTREIVGGQPAGEKSITDFVRHHMKITDPKQVSKKVSQILHEEIGERDEGPDEESAPALEETGVYQVCVVRRDNHGHWLGDWMIKAMLKQAGTQVGIFQKKKFTKGHLAEAGRIRSDGPSGKGSRPYRIYLVDDNGDPAVSYYQEFKGNVSTPNGRRSIVSHRECIPEESNIYFTFEWVGRKLSAMDVANILAMGQQVGLGSAKSYERGKFEVIHFETDDKPEPEPVLKVVKKQTRAAA